MDKFIKKIILGRTIQAAFQRGNVYANSNSLSKEDKDELKKSIKDELEEISNNYTNNISEGQHIKNIENLSQTISKNHSNKLKDGRLRIGTAQKLLNVYIKFLWCLNEAKEPKHCPIDGIVLKEIKDNRKWTDLKSIKEYKEIISKIRKHIKNNETIASWEWEFWNKKA
jgi:hypothetical protein